MFCFVLRVERFDVMNLSFKSWNYHLKLERLGLWSPALSALLSHGLTDRNVPAQHQKLAGDSPSIIYFHLASRPGKGTSGQARENDAAKVYVCTGDHE
jgi:hypothetical protein